MKKLAYVLLTSLLVGNLGVNAVNNEKEIINADKAKEIVLTQTNEEVKNVEVEYDKEEKKYEVEVKTETKKIEVDVDTKGNVVEKEVEKAKEKTKSKDTTLITKEKAKEVAFNHAGVKESEVTRLEVKLDKEDNEYEVDFYVGTTEYDYDINALTGKINHVEKEVEKAKEEKPAQTSNITKEEAKQIALTKAGVNADEIRDFEIELEDGRYEISFEVKNVEFEIEISLDGKVLKFEKEIDD